MVVGSIPTRGDEISDKYSIRFPAVCGIQRKAEKKTKDKNNNDAASN